MNGTHSTSRRNTPGLPFAKATAIFALASLCLFGGGLACFSHALETARAAQEQQASSNEETTGGSGVLALDRSAQPMAQDSGADGPTGNARARGVISSPGNANTPETASSEAAPEEPATEDAVEQHESSSNAASSTREAPKATGKARKDTGSASTSAKASKQANSSPSRTGAQAQAEAEAAKPAGTGKRTTRVIHHTAYKRTPVYRNERHYKAVCREVRTADSVEITWKLCPTCNKKHAKAFTKKVVDHYEEHLCKACDEKHAHAYTETVAG